MQRPLVQNVWNVLQLKYAKVPDGRLARAKSFWFSQNFALEKRKPDYA